MFKLEIETGNAAFHDPYGEEEENLDSYYEKKEVARILREVADKVESGRKEGSCSDYNGNKVGKFEF